MGIWYRQFLAYHPVIGWWFVPNLKAMIPHGNRTYLLRTNSLGMRSDREYPSVASTGRSRIILLGDSYTAGDGVDNGLRFSDLLEKSHQNLDVLNFGLPGSGTDQQLLIYETMTKPFKVDAYVFAPGIPDILRNEIDKWPMRERNSDKFWYMPKPYFTLEDNSLVLHNRPVPNERIPKEEASDRKESFTQKMDAKRRAANWPVWMQKSNFIRKMSLAAVNPYEGYGSENSDSWQLMRAIIVRFLSEVDEKPVFLIPMPTDHFAENLTEPTYLARFMALQNQSKRVYVVDILPHFKRLQPEKRKQCFQSDGHFTEYGHEIVTQAVSGAIEQYYPDLIR